MLFVSVGLVKAQSPTTQYIDLSIPVGTSGKVTITIKNTEAVMQKGTGGILSCIYSCCRADNKCR